MSTTAARIPAFRQCILPAGWDMARPPAVPGRALARPPRAPAGPAPRAPRRPLPAPAPAPGSPAARLAWAPPRLGAPRGSGDRALTSWRPSVSPRGPPRGRCPLPQRGHFQGSLGARPGRAAPGLRLRLAARAPDTAPAPPLRPRPGAPRVRAVRAPRPPQRDGDRLALSTRGARRRRSPSAPRPGPFPSCRAAGPRGSLASPRSPPLRSASPAPAGPAPGSLPRQRRLTRSPSPARRDTSPMLSLSLKQREKKHAPRGNRASSVQAKLPPRAGTAAGLPHPSQEAGRLEAHPAPSARRPPSRAGAPWRFDSTEY